MRFKKDEYLFLENDVYTHKCDYEYTIIAYYIENKNITNIRHSIINVLNNCSTNHIISNLFRNMKFYNLKLVPAVKCDMSFTLDHEINGKMFVFTRLQAVFFQNVTVAAAVADTL